MTKSPSWHRTSDITHYRKSKAKQKKMNTYKLIAEITELERQLKIHPMGAIVLKSIIKEKRAKLRQLDPDGKTIHSDDQLIASSRQGLLGLNVHDVSKPRDFLKTIHDDETLRTDKYRSTKTKRFPR